MSITIRPPSQAARGFMPPSVVGSPFSYTTVDVPVALAPTQAGGSTGYRASNLYLKQDLTAINVGGVTWPIDEVIYVPDTTWTCLLVFKAAPKYYIVALDYEDFTMASASLPTSSYMFLVTTVIPTGPAPMQSPAWPGFMPATKPAGGSTPSWPQATAGSTVLLMTVPTYLAPAIYAGQNLPATWYKPAATNAAPPPVPAHNIVLPPVPPPAQTAAGTVMLEIPTPEMTAYLETGKYMPIYASHQGGSFAIDYPTLTLTGSNSKVDEIIYVQVGAGAGAQWTCLLSLKAPNALPTIRAVNEQYMVNFREYIQPAKVAGLGIMVTTIIPKGVAVTPPAWPGLFVPLGTTNTLSVLPPAALGTVVAPSTERYIAIGTSGTNGASSGYHYKPAATAPLVQPPAAPQTAAIADAPIAAGSGIAILELPTTEMTAYLEKGKYAAIPASQQSSSFPIDIPTLTITNTSKVDEVIYVQVGAGAGARWTCLLSLKAPNALPNIRAVNERYMGNFREYIQPTKLTELGIVVTTIIPTQLSVTPPAWPRLFVPQATASAGSSVLPQAALGTVVAPSTERYIAIGTSGTNGASSGYHYKPAATAPLVQPPAAPQTAAIADAPIAAGSGTAILELPTTEMTAYLETGKYVPIYAGQQGGSFAIDYPTLTLTGSMSKVDEIIYVQVGAGASAQWTCLLSLKPPNALPTIRAVNERYMRNNLPAYIQPAKVKELGIIVTTIIPKTPVTPPAWPGLVVPSKASAGSVLPQAASRTVVAPSTERYIAPSTNAEGYYYTPPAATAPVLPFVPLTITISPPSARANMLINDTPTVPSTVLTLGSGNYSGSGYSLAPLALALSVTSKIYSLQEIVYVPNDPASAGSTCLLSFSSTIDGSRLVFSLTAQDYARVMPTVPSPNVTYSTVVGGVPDVSIWPGFHVPTSNDVAVAEPTPAGILRPTVARYYVTGSGAGTFYDPKALPCVALTACMSTLGSSLLECAAHAKACTLPASATVAARFQIDKTDIGLYALGPLALFGTSTDTIVVVKPTGINKASVLLIEKTKGAATTLSATLSGNVWTDDVTAAALLAAQTKTASDKAASDAQQSKTASDLDISNPQKLNAASEAQKIADAAAKTAQDAANVLTEVTAALAKTKQQQMDAQAALTATQNEKARLDKSNAQLQKDAADAKKTFDDAKTDFEKWNLAAATAQSGAADLLATTKQLNVAALAALAKTLGENAGLDRANVDLQKAAADAKKAADDAKAELDKVQKTATDIRAAVAQLAGQQKATDPVPASCTTLGTCLVAAGLGDLTTCAPQARACSPGTPASETLTFRGVSIPLYTVNGSPARYGKDATSIYVLQPGTVATTGTLLVVPVVTGASTVYAATLASAVWSVRPDAPGTSVPAGTDAPKPGKGFWTPLNIGLIVGGGVLFLVLLFALLMYKNDAPTNRIFPVKSG